MWARKTYDGSRGVEMKKRELGSQRKLESGLDLGQLTVIEGSTSMIGLISLMDAWKQDEGNEKET